MTSYYEQSNEPVAINVRVTIPGMEPWDDGIKGNSVADAMAKAKDNWSAVSGTTIEFLSINDLDSSVEVVEDGPFEFDEIKTEYDLAAERAEYDPNIVDPEGWELSGTAASWSADEAEI